MRHPKKSSPSGAGEDIDGMHAEHLQESAGALSNPYMDLVQERGIYWYNKS